ncbi:hypothetical protein LIER_23264 [Lithospermum erythrorhizon]|uniref:TPX2 C-terminal domain-containing protein n=1 Tax=Lithospermum erythrorhizon TaxID=34254 RepID=A0AAV3QZ40_LITER
MGRDVTGLRIDSKTVAKSNGMALDKLHQTAKNINLRVQLKGNVVKDPEPKGMANEESPVVLSINTEGEIKAVTIKPNEKMLNSPETNAAQSVQTSSPTPAIGPSKTNELHTPMTQNKLQPHSPWTSKKDLHPDSHKTRHDEEDAYSLASSAATSVRSAKFKVTVPMAPTFRGAERAERRKEFQKKLEEKQKALEAERLEYAARTKEEEEKVIKQLRKSMTYKANHVPSFYHEGPPPKVELKKLPVTRPKSPNFTRRKSCSDVIKTPIDEKKCSAWTTRHSIGVCKDVSASSDTPKSKDLSGTRNANGLSKFKYSNGSTKVKVIRSKEVKDTSVTLPTKLEQKRKDICVVSETKTKTTQIPEQISVPAIIEVKMGEFKNC